MIPTATPARCSILIPWPSRTWNRFVSTPAAS